MSPSSKQGDSGSKRPITDVLEAPATLSEVDPSKAPEELGPDYMPPSVRRKRQWKRSASVGLLGIGLVAGILLAMHGVNVNKQQALKNASQSDQSVRIKPQTIGLSNLGLQTISNLQQTGTLTVNGQLNVADSVVLEPSTQPTGAVAGQLFYDQTKNQLGYYNDKGFVYLQGGPTGGNSSVSNVSNVYNVTNVSNVSNITNVTNMLTGPVGVIPVFNGSGLSDSLVTETGSHITTTADMSVGMSTAGGAALNVAGATSDSSSNALTVADNSGDIYEQIADNGSVNLGRSPGAAFGNDVVFPSFDTGTENLITADKFTTTTATTVVSMSVYVGGVNTYPYNQYQLAIYTDNGGQPGTFVAGSPVGTLLDNSWNSLPVSATLAAGTPYWLAYTADNNTGYLDNPPYSMTSSRTHAWANFGFGSGSNGGLPTDFPPPGAVNDYTHSIYATTLGSGSALTLSSAGVLTSTGSAIFQDLNNSSTAFQVQNSSANTVFDVDTSDGTVGIGTTAPTKARLSVVGATDDNTGSALDVRNSDDTSLLQLKNDGSMNLGVSHAIFGSASSGDYTGSGYGNSGNQLLQAQSFTTTSGGTLNSLSTYIGQGISGTGNQYQMAVYSNVGGKPSALIASTNVGTLTNSGWNTLPINATLAPSTTYWLVYWTNTPDGNHNGQNFLAGYNGPNQFYQSFMAWQSGDNNGMPSTFPNTSTPSGGYETSIYGSFATPSSAITLDATGNMISNGNVLIQNSSSASLEVTDATGGVAMYVDGGGHDVGINTPNTGGYNFNVVGSSAFGDAANSDAFGVFDGSYSPVLKVDTSSASGAVITVEGGGGGTFATLDLSNAHFSSTQTTAPQIATPINCGTGTAPSSNITAGSTDSAGSLTITTGQTGPGNCDTVITFNKQYGSIPKSIMLTPTVAIGGATVSTDARVSAASATTFTVQIDSPAASTPYSYYYWVVQ